MIKNICPQCGSEAYKRNGYTRHGKQNHRCLDCGRQFSSNATMDQTYEVSFEISELFTEELVMNHSS